MSQLKRIYKPIDREMQEVSALLKSTLVSSGNKSILQMGNFLSNSPGKRIRTAMVILSAKGLGKDTDSNFHKIAKLGTAMELIHMASLIHDDVIDRSDLRHGRPTINSLWGIERAIALGDHLYSEAFDLIAACKDVDVLQCISLATKTMCDGELLQVSERDNLELSKQQYMVIVKKKTASLFAASCQAGAMLARASRTLQGALKSYGLNFGIAFQITDDYLDIIFDKEELGKLPGQDINAGELTLPVLNLLEVVSRRERDEFKNLLTSKVSKKSLVRIKSRLFDSGAAFNTMKTARFYITKAKKTIDILPESRYKESLLGLADFVVERGLKNTYQD